MATWNESEITELHKGIARRWIAENGIPETNEQLNEMGRYIVETAQRVNEEMTERVFQMIDQEKQDRAAGVQTLMGDAGREFHAMMIGKLKEAA